MNTVISQDGTTIAYAKLGHGPAVILVAGAFCSRTFWSGPELAKLLASRFTVYNYDRRAAAISSGAALQAAVQLGTKVKKLAMYESLVHCRGHSAVEHKALRPLY